MKTDVAASSIDYYYGSRALSTFADQEKAILAVMQHGKTYTRRELSRLTGIEVSSVAGRVNSLIHLGVIEVIGRKVCSVTRINVEALMLTPVQMEMAA